MPASENTTCGDPEDDRTDTTAIASPESIGRGDEPPRHGAERDDDAAPLPRRGDRIDPYVLIDKLGAGAYGEVWKAEQKQPVRREVAVKILHVGLNSTAVVARFRAEQQALAMMDHPGIAKVFDAGLTPSGLPYFVMQYVKGDTLLAYCDRERLTLTQRLELFALICDAVHHAHQKGIIHRDLKPQNVVVTTNDAGEAQPVVVDFGVAKALTQPLTDATVYSVLGGPQGTWAYMSPEQAEGLADIDTRSDIYSLGVVLYELLSGMRPFDDETFKDASDEAKRKVIREQEPPLPGAKLASDTTGTGTRFAECRRTQVRELAKTLRGELSWIPMYAMRKERVRRYRSAADLGDDARCYLAGRPLTAAPDGVSYRLRKFAGRNRWTLAFASTVFLATGLALDQVQRTRIATLRAEVAEGERSALRELLDLRDREAAALRFAASRQQVSEASLRFVRTLLTSAMPVYSKGGTLTVEELLDQAERTLRFAPPENPEVRLESLNLIGSSYYYLGQLNRAVPMKREALALATEVFGKDSARTAAIEWDLALLTSEAGLSWNEKGPVIQAADRLIALAVPGSPDAKDAKDAASTVAFTLLQRQDPRWSTYADWLAHAIAGSGDPQDDYYRCSLMLLNACALRPADSEQRLQAMMASVRAFADRFGERHPDTLAARDYIRTMLLSIRPDLALQLARESEKLEADVLPEFHPARASTQVDIGQLLAKHLGRPEEAIPYFQRAIDIWEHLDQHCGDILVAKYQLGSCLIGLRRREESYEFHRAAIASAEGCEGADEARLSFYAALASSCGSNHKDDCGDALRKTVELSAKLYGPESDHTKERQSLLDEFLETGAFGRDHRNSPLGAEPKREQQ